MGANDMGSGMDIEKVDAAIAYFLPFVDARIVPIEEYFKSFGPRVLPIIREHGYDLKKSGALNIYRFGIPRGWVHTEFALLKQVQELMVHRQKGGRLSRSRVKQIYDVLESRANPKFLHNCIRPRSMAMGKEFDKQLLYFKNAIGPAK